MVDTRTCRTLIKVKKIEWVYLFVFINSITLRYQIFSDSDANSVNFLPLGGVGSTFSVGYQGPIWGGLIYEKAYLLTISSFSFKLGHLSKDEQFYVVFRLFSQEELESLKKSLSWKRLYLKKEAGKNLYKNLAMQHSNLPKNLFLYSYLIRILSTFRKQLFYGTLF